MSGIVDLKSEFNFKDVSLNKNICGSCKHCELHTNSGCFRYKNPDHFCYKLFGVYVSTLSVCDLFERRE